jgi:N-acetyl-gamma-glutamyl-phosphate reductase
MQPSMTGQRVRLAILGATGYAGVELLRILASHPLVEVVFASSEQYRGRRLDAVYPFLSGVYDLELAPPDAVSGCGAEIVCTAVPHGTAVALVTQALDAGCRVLDLSADFRFANVVVYERWYGAHGAPRLLGEAVYGLPEVHREAIAGARLVAVPGCYPTGALLGLLPLARAGAVDGPIVIDAKSGTTGAGRSAKVEQLFAETNENFRPYAALAHRHGPEIEQGLHTLGVEDAVIFVPHLLPVSRGILTTMYVPVRAGIDVAGLFRDAYRDEPFVLVRGEGALPELREVRGTNRCVVAWRWHAASGRLVVFTAIDNLGKGAAGQAVQCLNLMLGAPETTGLAAPALGI